MSATQTVMSQDSTSSGPKARLAAFFYVLTFITGTAAYLLGRKGSAMAVPMNLAAMLCYVAVTVLFYGIFKAVSRPLSFLAALFSLGGCAWTALQAAKMVPSGINALIFFGVYCLLIGYLAMKATYLPSILGILMMIGGIGWLTFISPSLARSLSPGVMLPGVIGEGALTLWLLIAGVNVERWREQLARSGAS